MKNLKTFALSALSLFGFAACQQVEIAPDVTPEATHTVSFVAGAPETKTTVDISDGKTAKFEWTAEDVDRFAVYEDGVAATNITAGITNGIMSMLAEFPGKVPSTPKYQALFNSEVSATQIVTENSYAETTDVMISEVLDGTRGDNFVFRFKREVAFAKMTLKNLTSGAYVSSVNISSDKPIAGQYDMETGTFVNTSNVITLDVLNDVVDGNATVWFTTIPVEDATFTITVETTDDTETVAGSFTKTFTKTISLTRGDVTSFGVAMVKDAPKTYGFKKISAVNEYTPGDYIIVAHAYKDDCPTKGDFAIANNLTLSPDKLVGADVTNLIDNNVISESNGASYKLSLSGDIDNIIISNGTNILAYSSGTNLVLDGENKYWTLSLNEGDGGTFKLLNNSTAKEKTKRALLFQSYSTNGNNKTESLKFGAYAASNINSADYAAIELYKYQEVTPSVMAPYLNVSASKTSIAATGETVTITVDTNVDSWNATSDNAAFVVGKPSGNTVEVTVSKNTKDTERTATITVTAGTLSKTITLTQSAGGIDKFSKTYSYGSNDWSLTNYTDNKSYYLVPSENNSSVATISGIFTNKTIQSDVVIKLNVATYGNGDNPSESTFSIYADSECQTSVIATQSGTLPTSKTYTDAVYTVAKEEATAFSSDVAIKITKPGKQIRLKSITIEFSYSE